MTTDSLQALQLWFQVCNWFLSCKYCSQWNIDIEFLYMWTIYALTWISIFRLKSLLIFGHFKIRSWRHNQILKAKKKFTSYNLGCLTPNNLGLNNILWMNYLDNIVHVYSRLSMILAHTRRCFNSLKL